MLSLKGFLSIDGSGWALGLKQAESAGHKFSESMQHHLKGALIGIFGVEAVKEAYKRTIEYGEKIFDTSQRLAISTDAVQEWDYALKANGATVEAATNFLQNLAMARDKALAGDPEATASFKHLGVSEQDLRSDKRINDIGSQIAGAFKEGDAQKLIGALREVGGRGAGELVAAFKKGLEGQFEHAHELGAIIKPEDIVQLKLAGDRIMDLGQKITAHLATPIAIATKTLRYFTESWFALIDTDSAFLSSLMKGKGLIPSLIAAEKAWQASIAGASQKDKEEKEMAEKAKTGGEGESKLNDEKRKATAEKEMREEAVKRAHEQIKLQERLTEMVTKNNREQMTDGEKITDMIKERNELIKSQSLEDQIKAETLRGEINKQLEVKNESKINLTSLQQIGAHVSFVPMENAIQRNTTAIKENTDALKTRVRPDEFNGLSNDGGVMF